MKAVIFDLDGVITDTAHYHYVAWKNLASELGIEIDEVFNEQLKGISRIDSLERILEHGNRENDFDADEKSRLANKKNDEYVQLLDQVTKKDVLPGILVLLTTLKENGIKVGIASASKNAPMILEKLEVMPLVDKIANPDDVKAGKPAPDIFLEAARLLEVEAADSIGVEDAYSGVQAIKAANMRSVAVGTSEEIVNSGATVIVEDTAKVTFDLLSNM